MAEFNITDPEIIKMLDGITEEAKQDVADQIQKSLDSGEIKRIVEEAKAKDDGNTPERVEETCGEQRVNETKKIKKFLRNKDNKVIVKIVETDPWGGDRVLTTTLTYGNLVRETLLWEQKFKQDYGCLPGIVMDAPSLIYLLTIENKEGEELYKRTFWKKEEIKEFLIGGFDGILRRIKNEQH